MARPLRRFAFRLAKAWGCSVRELLARVDGPELTEWMAFERLEPFGERVEDWRWARLLALVHNRTSWSDKERAVTPEDYLPDYDGTGKRQPRVLSVEESKAAGRTLAGGPGAKAESVDEEIERQLARARAGVGA